MPNGSHRNVPRLQTLLDTVRLLNSTLELKELTGIILNVVRAEIAVERVSVFVVDREAGVLRPLVAQELSGEDLSFPIGVGIAGTVAATGDVLDILDAYGDPRFNRDFDRRFGYYTNDLLALPVSNRNGEIVGVLELLNRRRGITFADREFLLGISVYIGLALENAYLHARLLESKAEKVVHSDHGAVQGVHDPLSFAMGLQELIPEQGDLPTGVWNHLEVIRRGVNDATDAASQFQEFLTRQRDGRTRIDLGYELRCLGELHTDEWARHNIRTTLIAENTPPVYAYAYELRLVLAFLMRTAEAAVCQRDADRTLRIHSWCTEKSALVSMQLNGDLTESRGVAVANLILQECGGQIRLESVPQQGTIILVELPLVHESISE